MKYKEFLFYMAVANNAAEMSHGVRLKVGSIAVKDNRIISYGYNGTPPGENNCCEEDDGNGGLRTKANVIHAEINLIFKLAGCTESAKDAIIFNTHAPCLRCAEALHSVQVKAVYYKHTYRSTEGVEYLQRKGITCQQVYEEET